MVPSVTRIHVIFTKSVVESIIVSKIGVVFRRPWIPGAKVSGYWVVSLAYLSQANNVS